MVTYDARADVAVGYDINPTLAVLASTVGSVLAWYDASLAIVLPNTFARLFFPQEEPHAAAAYTIFVFGFGFLARPLGAMIFGHYGDRFGRKPMLTMSLLLMGVATALLGLLPTYYEGGIWATVGLVTLRVLQGVGVGGLWGAATLFSMEWAQPERRSFIAAWPQIGFPAGLVLAYLAVTGIRFVADDDFLIWGWRAICLISIVLVGLAVFINFRIPETPTITRLIATGGIETFPVGAAVVRQPKQLILVALMRLGELVPLFVFTNFVFVYAKVPVGSGSSFVLNAVLLAGTLSVLTIPVSGYLSDIIGQARIYMDVLRDRALIDSLWHHGRRPARTDYRML
jgi:MFS family permease